MYLHSLQAWRILHSSHLGCFKRSGFKAEPPKPAKPSSEVKAEPKTSANLSGWVDERQIFNLVIWTSPNCHLHTPIFPFSLLLFLPFFSVLLSPSFSLSLSFSPSFFPFSLFLSLLLSLALSLSLSFPLHLFKFSSEFFVFLSDCCVVSSLARSCHSLSTLVNMKMATTEFNDSTCNS